MNRVSGIAVEPEATVAVMVVVAKETEEEAWRLPAIWREEAMVEEAEEINPARVESPAILAVEATVKVEEAESGPAS